VHRLSPERDPLLVSQIVIFGSWVIDRRKVVDCILLRKVRKSPWAIGPIRNQNSDSAVLCVYWTNISGTIGYMGPVGLSPSFIGWLDQ